ncbi:hypothetical protein KIW84_043576 [Lathyrus oleraceus]|uniref:Uncharacterized protein n=1 Tax=Pisum sativum TaxID=3888 RepID=A0A9D4XFM9_PEA|nr:hypothetical protein KIW84_043576 [Pisum sativum]
MESDEYEDASEKRGNSVTNKEVEEVLGTPVGISRVTLVKSVMEAIPVNPTMTNTFPKACIEEIQGLQRNFNGGQSRS